MDQNPSKQASSRSPFFDLCWGDLQCQTLRPEPRPGELKSPFSDLCWRIFNVKRCDKVFPCWSFSGRAPPCRQGSADIVRSNWPFLVFQADHHGKHLGFFSNHSVVEDGTLLNYVPELSKYLQKCLQDATRLEVPKSFGLMFLFSSKKDLKTTDPKVMEATSRFN